MIDFSAGAMWVNCQQIMFESPPIALVALIDPGDHDSPGAAFKPVKLATPTVLSRDSIILSVIPQTDP